jgi:hypothetical protein
MDIEEKETEDAIRDTEMCEDPPADVDTDDVDADLEILDEPPAVFKTPRRKKKTLKVKVKLDDGFLRRSKRILEKL